MDDEDAPEYIDSPASDYIAVQWREAMRATREGMEAVRRVWPELTQHLSETGAGNLKVALDDLQTASRYLHMAGRHVLGDDGYSEYLDATTRRQIEG